MNHASSIAVLLCLATALPVRAAETISFVAQVENEDLAEEAILLIHCLSGRRGTGWEFNGEVRGQHWLRVREKNHLALGTYRSGEIETPFELRAGDSEKVCETLEPSGKTGPALTPVPKDEAMPPLRGSSEGDVGDAFAPSKKTWLWVGLAGAVLATGFLVYKSRRPTHSSIEMNQ